MMEKTQDVKKVKLKNDGEKFWIVESKQKLVLNKL